MSKFEVATYSPADIVLVVSGFQIEGWSNISLTRNAPRFREIQGIRGKNTRCEELNTSATLSISIMQTEIANEVFSTILDLDSQYKTGRLTITLKDTFGESVFNSVDAYIGSDPVITYSNDIEYRNWTITCESTQGWELGGGTKSFQSLLNLIGL